MIRREVEVWRRVTFAGALELPLTVTFALPLSSFAISLVVTTCINAVEVQRRQSIVTRFDCLPLLCFFDIIFFAGVDTITHLGIFEDFAT
jgi:hypothetical protein